MRQGLAIPRARQIDIAKATMIDITPPDAAMQAPCRNIPSAYASYAYHHQKNAGGR